MITVTAKGKKGAAPRELQRKVRELLDDGAGAIPIGLVDALKSGQAGANKMIARAGRGSSVDVQLTVEDDPRGGWCATVLVNVDPAPPRRPR